MRWAKERGPSSGSKVEKEAAACRLFFCPVKQSLPSVVTIVALEDDSEDFVASSKFIEFPGIISHTAETLEQILGDRTPPLTRTQKLCRFSVAQSSEIDDLVVTYGDDSKQDAFINTLKEEPGTCRFVEIEPERALTKKQQVDCLPLKLPEFDSENGYLVGEIEHESSQMNNGNQLLDDRGRCSITETSSKRPEFRIPNFSLDVLRSRNLTPDDGWKNADDGLSSPRSYQGLEAIEKCTSMMEQANSSSRLKNEGSNHCNSTFDDFPEFIAKLGSTVKILAWFPTMIIVDIGQGGDVDSSIFDPHEIVHAYQQDRRK
ncbi:unnamed protein product [Linum trigynum]|uniref:Uncharacterized protein n=1 Tax=Linum trigynum TaxID=586398 RepID=A0AAV2E8I2_9ROSI